MEKSSDVANEARGPGFRVLCATALAASVTMKRYSEIAILVPSEGAHGQLSCAPFGDEPFGAEPVARELRSPLIALIPARCAHSLEWHTRADVTTLLVSHGSLESIGEEFAHIKRADLKGTLVVLDPVIRHVAEDFRAQLRSHHPCDRLYLESVALLIASRLLRSYCDVRYSAVASGGLPGHKRRRALEFIQSRLGEAICVGDVAAAVAMSPCHFTRLFKRSTGRTPYQYITMARIERAKALLRERDRSQVDIALSVGYETQSHFATVFRRIVGLTPGAYRRLHAGSDNPFAAIGNRIAARVGRL